MKHTKKLASLLLALALAFALAVPAFAEGETTYSITINNATPGHTYEAYQIFTGDLADSTLSNIKWGSGVSEAGQATLGKAAEKASSITTADGAAAFAKDVDNYLTMAAGSTNTVSNGVYVISNLAPGYYLIKDKDNSLTNKENEFYTRYILEVVKDVTVTPKGDIPTTEKKIVEDDNKVDVNEASIGDTVNYEITGTLPTNLIDYNTYYYVFTDTLSKGLTPVDANNDNKIDLTVEVDGTDLTKYFYVSATTYSETSGTTITVGIQDLLALSLLDGVNVTSSSKIVITYSATLNENAVIAGEGNPNDVKLTYSNNPNDSGDGKDTTQPPENPNAPTTSHPTGDTPKDTVVTYTTELTILKKDGEGKVLSGVEFRLTGEGVNIVLVTTEKFTVNAAGEYWKLKDGTYTTTAPTTGGDDDNSADYDSTETKYSKTIEIVAKGEGKGEEGANTTVVGVIDEGGHVTFTGLGAGEYTITETKTPAGYNTVEPITFTITFDAATKTFKSNNEKVVVGADNKLDTTIINNKGAELPSTGGMGTTVFYVLGGVLVVGAVVLLITKKRMGAEN